MKIEFLPVAQEELAEARIWLNRARPGHGDIFIDHVYAALERIASFPDAWPRQDDGLCKYVVLRFHYTVLYRCRPGLLLVTGIVHHSRGPKAWRER